MLTDGVVSLTHPRIEDADAIAATVGATLDTLIPWMFWATPDYDAGTALEFILTTQDDALPTFSIRLTDDTIIGDTIIGGCGLHHHDVPNHCAELGYWVASAHTGNGYATRAARLLIAHAFESLDMRRVTILVSVHNQRSQRVAERLAGAAEGTLRSRLRVRDEWHDAHVYGVVAS